MNMIAPVVIALLLSSIVMYKTSISLHDLKNPSEIYFKTAGTLILVALATLSLIYSGNINPVGIGIITALVISAMGDLTLAIADNKDEMSTKADVDYFIIGMILFVLGYLTYTISITTTIIDNITIMNELVLLTTFWPVVLLIVIISITQYTFLYKFEDKMLEYAVLIYMIQITLLPLAGLLYLLFIGGISSVIILVASILIYISDSILAYVTFNPNPISNFNHHSVMYTYIAGQVLFASSILFMQ